MNRTEFFNEHRPLYPDGRIPPEHVKVLDTIADRLGLARIETAAKGLNPSPACINLIKEFESCRLTAYPDPGSGADPWTIGWGSTGPGIRKGTVWTQAQADSRFSEHVTQFGRSVEQLLNGAATNQHQFDALVSLAYNIGTGNLSGSTLLKKHKAGDYAGAAAEFARWNKASGKVMAGLTRRRAAEAAMYRGEA